MDLLSNISDIKHYPFVKGKCITNDMETTIITDMSREKAKIKLTITKVPHQLRNLDS